MNPSNALCSYELYDVDEHWVFATVDKHPHFGYALKIWESSKNHEEELALIPLKREHIQKMINDLQKLLQRNIQ